jgi:hypothetical protein
MSGVKKMKEGMSPALEGEAWVIASGTGKRDKVRWRISFFRVFLSVGNKTRCFGWAGGVLAPGELLEHAHVVKKKGGGGVLTLFNFNGF